MYERELGMIHGIVSSISAGILGPHESQNNALCFALLFPCLLSGCLAGFVNSQKGHSREFDFRCPNYLRSQAMVGSLLGARGNVGLFSDLL